MYRTVLVFEIDINDFRECINIFFCLLNKEEKQRSEAFSLIDLKEKFIIRRGILRCLISQFNSERPNLVRFIYNEYGKPMLEKGSSIYFNLSHSNEKVVYAFAYDCSIGIDIEYKRPFHDLLNIARESCTPDEYKIISGLETQYEQLNLFYDIWAAKEALSKAIGQGLSYPINTIEIINKKSSYPRMIVKDRFKTYWWINCFQVIKNYSCALALQKPYKLQYQSLKPETIIDYYRKVSTN
ncbi:MAG: hypothetical protein BGO76_00260 [Caedibacter sp. 38-128]|nr:4'-phosphopantetheinyl transferase superfamily protein [Holosporales bacterium]OJX05018.1 MAG: hypothetical protein BGO76_00260 [Caedibacter sp. 38-128]